MTSRVSGIAGTACTFLYNKEDTQSATKFLPSVSQKGTYYECLKASRLLTEEVDRIKHGPQVEVSFVGHLAQQAVDALLVGCAYAVIGELANGTRYFLFIYLISKRALSSRKSFRNLNKCVSPDRK